MDIAGGQYSLTFMTPTTGGNAAGYDPAKPDFVTDASRRMYQRSQRCRHLNDGLPCIEANLWRYLPQYPNEDPEDYALRRKMVSFRNFYAQAKITMMGKVFAQPPRLKDDVPLPIQEDLENADLNGLHWTMLARDYFNSALNEGISWMVVDYTPTPVELLGRLTLRDEADLGLRPYWFVVPQSQVLGVRYRKVGKVKVLTQFRFIEWEEEEDGEFGSTWVEYIYVYEENRIRKFARDNNAGWLAIIDRPNTLGRVPAVPLNLDRVGAFEAKPPLENLAAMNIEHLQIKSDQRRALSVSSFPILVTSGVEAKPGERTRIGPLNSVMLEDPQATVKWVETQGTALRAGDTEIKKLEDDIRVFGLSFENPQMYATATGRNIDASDAIAPIQLWAHQARDALEVVLWFHAQWRRMKDGGSIDINVSFLRNMITIEGLKLLIEALKEGAITPRGLLTRLKEYGILSEDFDVDKDVNEALAIAEEAQKRMIEAKKAAALTNNPNDGGNNDDPNAQE